MTVHDLSSYMWLPHHVSQDFSAEDNDQVFSENLTQSNSDGMPAKDIFEHSTDTMDTSEKLKDLSVSCGSTTSSGIKISKDSNDELASFMKTLASWEDLVEAVAKINSQVCKHNGQNGIISFTENDVEPLGFGRKEEPTCCCSTK